MELLIDKLMKQIEENKNTENEKDNLSIWNEINRKLLEQGFASIKEPRNPEELISNEAAKKLKDSNDCIERVAFYIYRISQTIPPISKKFQELSERLEEVASYINKEKMLPPEKVEDILLFILGMGIGTELAKGWAEMVRVKIESEQKDIDINSIVSEVKDRVSESIREQLEKENKEALNRDRSALVKALEEDAQKKLEEWKKREIGDVYEQAYRAIQDNKKSKDEIIDCLLMNLE